MGISGNRHCHSIGWKEERWMKFQRVKKGLITNESPKGHPTPITRRSTPRFGIENAWKGAKFRRRKRKILFQCMSDDMEIIQSLMPEVVKNFGEHKLKGEFIVFLKLVAADRIPMDKCLNVGAHNPSTHMQETTVTELHSPATRVFNTLRPKKWHFAQLTCLWVF